jgi:hypothetical protein
LWRWIFHAHLLRPVGASAVHSEFVRHPRDGSVASSPCGSGGSQQRSDVERWSGRPVEGYRCAKGTFDLVARELNDFARSGGLLELTAGSPRNGFSNEVRSLARPRRGDVSSIGRVLVLGDVVWNWVTEPPTEPIVMCGSDLDPWGARTCLLSRICVFTRCSVSVALPGSYGRWMHQYDMSCMCQCERRLKTGAKPPTRIVCGLGWSLPFSRSWGVYLAWSVRCRACAARWDPG